MTFEKIFAILLVVGADRLQVPSISIRLQERPPQSYRSTVKAPVFPSILGICLSVCLQSPLLAQKGSHPLATTQKVDSAVSDAESPASRGVAAEPGYKIGPQDVLRIDVW